MPFLNLRSATNRIFFKIRNRLRWSRQDYREKAAGQLLRLPQDLQEHILYLQRKYQVKFEEHQSRENSLENYCYLDILDQMRMTWNWQAPKNKTLLDVGSKNFFYAPVLHSFFHPRKLIGIEIDGYKVYEDLHSRADYAQHYIRELPNTFYKVMDICDFNGKAEGITCFYPFVTPEALVGWSLPLECFRPEIFFQKLSDILPSSGWLLLFNHGETEWEYTRDFCRGAGLALKNVLSLDETLLKRQEIPFVSLWVKH